MNSDLRQSQGYQALLRRRGALIESLGGDEVCCIARVPIVTYPRFIVMQRVQNPASLDAVEQLIHRHLPLYVKVAPKALLGTPEGTAWEEALRRHGYTWDKSPAAPTRTILVDLHLSEKELLGRMKPKTRYNIGLSQRRGVRTEIVDGDAIRSQPESLEAFYTLYSQNCRRISTKAAPRPTMTTIMETFGKNLFVVFGYLRDGQAAAVALFLVTGNEASYQMNGSTEQGRHDFASTLVVWHGILEARRRGCLWFDFDGVADSRYKEEEEWEGFTRFKEGFGGNDTTYTGSYIRWLPFLRSQPDTR